MHETTQIDKLFLELSQFTKATTAREAKLERAILGALTISDLWLPPLNDHDHAHPEESEASIVMNQKFPECMLK